MDATEIARTAMLKQMLIKAGVLVLTVVMLSPIVATLSGVAVPTWTLPYLSISSGFFLALVFWYLSDYSTKARSGERSQSDMLQEISALNRHAMVWLTDKEGRIFHVNEKLLEATGYVASDLLDKNTDPFYGEEAAGQFDAIREGLRRGKAWTGETPLKCKSGEMLWTQATILPRLDNKGELVGSISIRTDITAAKMAAEQKDLYTTLHSLTDEVYMLDPETLKFSYLNEAAQMRQGWTDETYIGKSLDHDCPGMDGDNLRAQIIPLLAGETDQVNYAETLDDRAFDIRVQQVSSFTGQNKLVLVMRDTSDQVEMERIQSELLATISHELRTPMTSIKGAMGLLLSNAAGELPDKAREMLSIAYRNADRLVMIINDILDIEKIAAGQMEFDMKVAPLAPVIEEAIASNEQFANRFDVTVVRDGLDDTYVANFDFGRTLQVLTNLLSNAAKFSPPGGQVFVSIARMDDWVRISVKDQGKGIPPEDQEKIFDRFAQGSAQTQPRVASTGLGLNIAKAIMDQQNGSIGVDSEVGKGSTFFIEFPIENPTFKDKPRTLYIAG